MQLSFINLPRISDICTCCLLAGKDKFLLVIPYEMYLCPFDRETHWLTGSIICTSAFLRKSKGFYSVFLLTCTCTLLIEEFIDWQVLLYELDAFLQKIRGFYNVYMPFNMYFCLLDRQLRFIILPTIFDIILSHERKRRIKKTCFFNKTWRNGKELNSSQTLSVCVLEFVLCVRGRLCVYAYAFVCMCDYACVHVCMVCLCVCMRACVNEYCVCMFVCVC